MTGPDIEMTTVYVYGQPFEVPRALVDDYYRLRALERRRGEEERERRLAEWEARHGLLPEPQPSPWVKVEP